MKRSSWIALGCGLATALAGCWGPLAAAAPPELQSPAGTTGGPAPVVVHVRSGRSFSGNLASRTDARRLWLQSGGGAVTVLRPIDWDCVTGVSIVGQEFSGEELHRLVREIRQRMPAAEIVASTHWTVIDPGETASAGKVRPAARPVRHLAIDAEVGGWSDTADPDGLILEVRPVDAAGRLVAVHGMLEVDLASWRTGVTPDPQPFFTVARWTQTVRPEDFGPGGAIYHLPFQNVRPDFDLEVASRGAVHVRLGVAGQGTFDATQSSIRIRPHSIVRDNLQQATGHRFLPQERTSDGRH
ncbi:MAG: hypothetical protein ABR915_11320 [Thermoguttaceae bacterium]